MVSVLPVMSFPTGPLKVSAGAVACVRSHCVSGFMSLSGRECRKKYEARLHCVASGLSTPVCPLPFPAVHTQRQEGGGSCEAGDGWKGRGAPGCLLQP